MTRAPWPLPHQVWLSSDEAAYVTGASLTVDGGQFIETAPSWTSKGRHGADE